MATIVPCPRCRQPITLPDETTPDHRFLCPLCEAAFDVGEALGLAAGLAPGPAAQPTAQTPLQIEFVRDLQSPLPSSTATQRRARKTPWIGHFVGIVGGGVIGLTAGYLILLKLRGPEADFLHVAERLPAWASELLSLPQPPPENGEAPAP